MILTILKTKFYNLIDIGINDTLSHYDKVKVRILNSLILILLCFQTSVWTQEFIHQDWKGVKILTLHIVFSIILFYLNKNRRFRLTSFLINFLYSFALFGLVFVYLKPNNLEYIFVFFIFTSVILSQKKWEKIILVIINLGFYTFTQTDHELIGKAGKTIDTTNNFMLFIMTVGTFVVVLHILLSELKRYELNNKALILALKEKNKKLLNVNEELERFTYVVSHDMKTPLRAINSFISILERKLQKEDETTRYFKYIKDATKQLHQLIMDSLEYAKLGQDAIQMERISTNELVFDLVRNFSSKNIEIYTNNYPDISSNNMLVRKLFQNIIENGIKYNNSEIKTINITAIINGNHVVFAFKDNGIGIDRIYYKQIFEMYKRLNSRAKVKGTGLGLAISKKIAKQLDGDIWVESIVGEGSIFYIRLPKA